MNTAHFNRLCDQFEESPRFLDRTSIESLASEAIERMQRAEGWLMQIGATHAGDKLFLSLRLSPAQAAVVQQATEAIRGAAKFDIERELTAIADEWLATRQKAQVIP